MDFFLKKIDDFWDTATNVDEKMKILKRKLEVLNALQDDMESRRSTKLHPRKKLKEEVELWFRNVDRINGDIQDLELRIRESNVLSRGLLKGNVFKKIQEVEELFQQGKSHGSLVVDNPEWIGRTLSTTTLVGETAQSCMHEIWAYLMDDNIQKIGVWGVGGIGKTTIMKLIHSQLLKETEKFDIVMWVTVSKELNVLRLQNMIAHATGTILDEYEDATVRAGMIYEMLHCKGKYVLILDDLWDKLSLEEVGIPEPSNGSKLLVTTQLIDVCYYLDCRVVRVPTLPRSDALSLFFEKVGRDVLNCPDLLPIVESVAEECAGLPLAIVTVASSMKAVRNAHDWRNALYELKRRAKGVNTMEENVYQQLEFSYDLLQDENVKHCFLCCVLYPKDFEIDANKLIDLWIAEGLVGEMDSMQKEIEKGAAILTKLKNSCLIEDINVCRDRVKLHDVVRDMALRMTRSRFLVRAGMQLKEMQFVLDWGEDLEKVSLMENWDLEIPSQMSPPKLQMLTTLLLSRCSIKSIPECFFEQMRGLKLLDLSHTSIVILPNSISNLENLTTLLLAWCEHLKKVPSFSKLKALKKLDLSRTNIKDIPHGMERLVKLRYLDLNYTRITEMPNGVLANLTSLQLLKLDNFSEISLRGEEIVGLRKLEIFEGRFYDLKESNSYVQALNAPIKTPSQYNICLGDHPLEDAFNDAEKVIHLNGCNITCADDIKVLSDVEFLNIVDCIVELSDEGEFFSLFIPVPFKIFSSLSRIRISNCKNIKKLFSSDWVLHNLQNLDDLCVEGCEDVEEIIASESEEEGISGFKYTFPKLCRLELLDLPELKSICGANGVMVCHSIKVIEIAYCPNLKRMPLNLPLQDDGQPSPPPSLECIYASPKEWWELVEWDHSNAKSLLEPFIHIF